MAIFDSLFGKKPAPKKSTIASRVEERLKNPPPMENVLRFAPGVLTGMDANYSTILFENGTVYYDYARNIGKDAIGYYQPSESNPNSFEVFHNGTLIGTVDRCGILRLSRIGQYSYKRNILPDEFKSTVKWPDPLTYSLEFRGDRYGEIFELDTREVVCTFNGDPVGAAAAFICGSFELHIYSKYAKFYQW